MFTIPFRFEPTGCVLAIMQRFYRFVTWRASFRYSIASPTRLILSCGSLMSSLESLWLNGTKRSSPDGPS